MATYAIGDIQGCFTALMQLLDKIAFNPKIDKLWLTGDLINRGPNSLETLRFLYDLSRNTNSVTAVLGNHDITLLAVAYGAIPFHDKKHTFQDILDAPDKIDLIEWLRHQPFLHHDSKLEYTLVHAGLYPDWNLKTSLSLAKEIETLLQSDVTTYTAYLKNSYGNKPHQWDPSLSGWDRSRFITSCFTRMRFCDLNGRLDLTTTSTKHPNATQFLPWFEIPNRQNCDTKIIFGHWAALENKRTTMNVFPLDTGCVWGGCLTAMRLEDQHFFKVTC